MIRITTLCLLTCLVAQPRVVAVESRKQPNQPAVQESLAADIEIAAEHLRATLAQTWQVETNEREIRIKYPKPVGFGNGSYYVNLPASLGEKETRRQEAEFRKTVRPEACIYILRFDEKMPLVDYQKIRRAKEQQRDQLEASVRHIPHKFDDYLPSNEHDRKLLVSYRRGMSELNKQLLPDLYTTDHSILLTRSWSGWDQVADQQAALQIDLLEQTLCRLFGVYDPVVARKGTRLGKYKTKKSR